MHTLTLTVVMTKLKLIVFKVNVLSVYRTEVRDVSDLHNVPLQRIYFCRLHRSAGGWLPVRVYRGILRYVCRPCRPVIYCWLVQNVRMDDYHCYRPQTNLRRLCFYRCLSVHGGACVVARGGGVHGCSGGACVVAPRGGGMRGCSRGGVCGCSGGLHGCSWGGVHGCSRGACMVAPRGACMVAPGGACVVAPGGACVVARGGLHGCSQGGMRGCSWGCVWLLLGGSVCGCSWGGVHGCSGGVYGCWPTPLLLMLRA